MLKKALDPDLFEENSGRNGYKESEAVRRLMNLMSDRDHDIIDGEVDAQYKTYLSKGLSYRPDVGQLSSRGSEPRNSDPADGDNMLRRAEQMRREVETTLDSVRRYKAESHPDDARKKRTTDLPPDYLGRKSHPNQEDPSNVPRRKFASGDCFTQKLVSKPN